MDLAAAVFKVEGPGRPRQHLAGAAHVGGQQQGCTGDGQQAEAGFLGGGPTAGPPLHGAGAHDFAAAAIHNPDVDGHVVLGFDLLLVFAKTQQPEGVAGAFCLHVGVVGGDGAEHDVAGSRQLALAGRIAVVAHQAQFGQLLLREHFFDVVALNHLEFTGGRQFVAQGMGQIVGHRPLPPPGGLADAVLEIGHRNGRQAPASLGPRGWGPERRHPGGRQRQGQAHDQPQATRTAPGGEAGPLGRVLKTGVSHSNEWQQGP